MSPSWRGACGVLLAALACAQPAPAPVGSREAALRDQLIPTRQIKAGFFARQRLRFRSGERSGSIAAVVQVECGTLTIVGLTPIGTRLFTIQQRGLDVQIDPVEVPDWPFSPLDVLLDVHRSLLYPVADPPLPDGRHAVRVRGLETIEVWEHGQLRERVVPETRGAARGRFSIRYPVAGATGPVQLSSELYDYAIEVETIESHALDCSE